MANMQNNEMVIIGGGIIGLLSAIHLQRAGLTVTIIQDQQFPASYGNAGHIAIEQVMPLANRENALTGYKRLFCMEGALDIGWQYPHKWLPWFANYLKASFSEKQVNEGKESIKSLLNHSVASWERLVNLINQPDLLMIDGHYVIYHNKDKGKQGCNNWQNADIGTASVHSMDKQTLERISQQLSTQPVNGLCFDKTGQIKNVSTLLEVCKNHFIEHGGIFKYEHVTSIQPDNGQTKITFGNNIAITNQNVLICAGARSGELLKNMGEYFPVIAERGYHIEWEHDGSYDLPPLVFEDHSFIVTRFENRLRLASFVEFTQFSAKPDERKWGKLEEYANKFGFSRKSEFKRWVGSRPTLPDYRPIIGKSKKNPGLFFAFGHQHLGLTLAAITGEIITDLVMGKQPSVSISAFRPDRF
ncbi:Glycine/D-amino acid oxidase (deaminating) (DadA) (PDB:3AWI) [Commensalibacter communis]|uniref:Glycine/D-amino acid oxidase (Deaminating) (DadA) n=1 Tax=Commensalibacter communis TaxID=2972786 RepID=A0A9W4X693_9PROT|nr:FAD-binding oxidoreductase [Commensalibacter communis]CAI3925705.1 Glycine/D-amino acid oxidase (deaminating) (DadA) (PDB:3AWI) [Commensalibacter communis]CAI3926255.1 Glycine/D-amino acid oxidase (deaminating) (DadA) (PDB:3AWI) [Commensalibacter communis]CAI3935109.1 Glycine/D-amino acid oxidase (deaminating) (DadA) (PDB:3AWI) [Commensalibacter communis]CAI3936745.1 Glycine/D-amino acid oxidase (deaminating) (DadA) (PDB:3AWI) [Commensalibacter communis]